MKKLLGTLVFSAFTLISYAQNLYTIVGKLVDEETNQPIVAATVRCNAVVTASRADGTFSLGGNLQKGTYLITVTSIGYMQADKTVTLTNGNIEVTIKMYKAQKELQALEISSIRAADNAPFTKTNLKKADIEKVNLGQDIPFLLNQTPSVVINSDAGNGVGYTGIRIRGTDASRINVTLNGIPYNDAESQGTFFVDLPDGFITE